LQYSSVSSGEFHARGDTGCHVRVLCNDYLIRNRNCLLPYSITTQLQVQRGPRMSSCAARSAVSRWQISMEQWRINYQVGEIDEIRRNPESVPVCPAGISHEAIHFRNRGDAMRSQRLMPGLWQGNAFYRPMTRLLTKHVG
jgi:hypothetical protein